MRIITDENLAYERFIKGDLDVTTFNQEHFATKVKGIDKKRIGDSKKSGKSVWAQEVKNSAPRGYQYIGWNLREAPFNDPEVRRSLAHLVDYNQIIEKVYYGLVYQATSPFGSLTMNSDQSLRKPGKMITFDRSKGIKMLRDAGWKDTDGDNIFDKTINGKKVPLRFTLKYNANNPLRAKIAQIVKENFKAAGVDVEVKAMEWNAYLDDVDNRKFDAILLGWTGTMFPNAKQIWHSSSEKNMGSNAVGYSNPKVDALIEQSNLEFDLEKRAKMMQELNRLIYEDQPYVFLTEPRSMLAGYNSKVNADVWAFKYDVSPSWDIYSYTK